MITLSLNVATLGPVLLILFLSFVLGLAVNLIGAFFSGFGQLAIGFARAVAGGRASANDSGQRRFRIAVALRAVVYLAICTGAIFLSRSGYQGCAYLCAVFGGFTLSIALCRVYR